MPVDLKTAAGIKAEIAGIAKAGVKLDARIQACAVASLEHMVAHRDHTLLVDLYKALSKGQRRASMASWILAFSQLAANDDQATKADKPFILDKEKTADVEGAKGTLWHEAGKPEAAPDEVFDANKAILAILAKAKKAADAGRTVKGVDADTLSALSKYAKA